MGRIAYELVFAVAALAAVTAGYVWLAQKEIPRPTSAVGYALGIIGFLMMLSTETLYSLRKRWTGFHFGPMSVWLQWHVFTGLVGPYLVLLHSGWRFEGLAGVLTIVVGVVVLSGVVGRYIYTAVPRHLDGAALAMYELEERIEGVDQRLRELGMDPIALAAAIDLPQRGWVLVLARPWWRRRQKALIRTAIRKLNQEGRLKAAELETLLTERQRWLRELRSLETVRRLLALWHAFHVPLSAGLFALAFVHVGAALYYAAFTM